MMIPRLRVALFAAGLAAAAALGVAFASEWYGGLVPCALCLVERIPYRIAIYVALLGLLAPRRWARLAAWLIVPVILAGAAVAFVHVGVEQKFWPSPLPECAAPHITAGASITERLAAMPATPSKPCDDPTFLIAWLPLSFAAMNFIYALAFSAVLATFLWRTRGSDA
jgi:disulfide bond formation protein DsbB